MFPLSWSEKWYEEKLTDESKVVKERLSEEVTQIREPREAEECLCREDNSRQKDQKAQRLGDLCYVW
jgi:hypothetical protein